MTPIPFREDDEISIHADRELATLKKYSHLEKMACKSRAELSRANAIRGGKARKSPPVTLAKIEIGKGNG
jgi:hypothetical protein